MATAASRSPRWSAALLLALGLFSTAATAEEDEASLLYSSQVNFDSAGVPQVTIGMAEGLERVELRASGGMLIHYREEAGGQAGVGKHTAIPPDRSVTVAIVSARPATVSYWCGVARLPFSEREKLEAVKQFWQAREPTVRVFETGGVLGVLGQLIDNRTMVVAVRPNDAEADARRVVDEIFRRTGNRTFIHQHLEQRPGGVLAITDEKSAPLGIAVDLINAAALDGGVVKVTTSAGEWLLAGRVLVTFDRGGRLVLVNRIDIERMLEGLVPAEIPASVHLEALKAQAVVARGQVFSKLGARHFLEPYLLCAHTHCQVYAGSAVENPRASEAVRATRGQLLFWGDALVDTVYSANCGGHTEDNDAVWSDPPSPALRGRPDLPAGVPAPLPNENLHEWLVNPPDSFCRRSSLGREGILRWSKDITAEQMERLVSAEKKLGRVMALQPLERGVSGRIKVLRLVGTEDDLVVQGELAIRQLLGGLRSSLFTVQVELDENQLPAVFHLHGAGWGHGVGLCQAGAVGMAEAGYAYPAILAHYYGGAVLKQVYGTPPPEK